MSETQSVTQLQEGFGRCESRQISSLSGRKILLDLQHVKQVTTAPNINLYNIGEPGHYQPTSNHLSPLEVSYVWQTLQSIVFMHSIFRSDLFPSLRYQFHKMWLDKVVPNSSPLFCGSMISLPVFRLILKLSYFLCRWGEDSTSRWVLSLLRTSRLLSMKVSTALYFSDICRDTVCGSGPLMVNVESSA